MTRRSHRSLGHLSQRSETWHVAIHQLRSWIAPEDEAPWRPYIILALNLDNGMLQTTEMVPNYPTPEELLKTLSQAMMKPPLLADEKPHRPTQVQLEDTALVAALSPEMVRLGITMQQHPRPGVVDAILRDLELHLRGKPELPGLLSVEGVTPALAGGLFAAAAEFYRSAPWIQLAGEEPLALGVPPDSKPRFAQVMGAGGVEYGLAAYRRWEDLLHTYQLADHPLELLPPEGGLSLLFDDITRLPFDDLEAMERYGWEVADERAYPLPVIFTRDGQARRPNRADLAWYEAALRAIPIFVRDHLRTDEPGDAPLEVAFPVSTHLGETTVTIKYPAGTLPKETRPLEMTDWPKLEAEDEEGSLPFDRRAMEGMLATFGGGFDDPSLEEAQQLMYQAWDESNPARRLILAHEALELSPDCADAYVLLAEEEADTLGHALEYYQQGVEAGERALGEDYFEENAGHFWGLLATRPYMRARHGLANCLWKLGREEEALAHYHGMLRLNPGDNQGIRYVLLNLLLRLNRDGEAKALLQQYEEDAMAEWQYTRALLAFREGGPSREAEEALQEALQQNPHVPAYLTARKRIPTRLPAYIGWGDDNEAVTYVNAYLFHWRRTPGAIGWLQSHLKPSQADRSKGKTKKSQRRKREASRRAKRG